MRSLPRRITSANVEWLRLLGPARQRGCPGGLGAVGIVGGTRGTREEVRTTVRRGTELGRSSGRVLSLL